MGQHIQAAIDRFKHTFHIRRMREDRHVVTMSLFNRSLGNRQGQHCSLPLSLVGNSKQFDSIRAFGSVIATILTLSAALRTR